MLGFGLENEEMKLMKQKKEERAREKETVVINYVKEKKTVAENVNF